MKRPPKILEWILERFLRYEDYETILGDFDEKYLSIIQSKGLLASYVWYIFQIITSIPKFIKGAIIWSSIMIKSYVKIAVRNLLRHKLFSFINVFSLAIGLAISILITLFVVEELSYDKFHEKRNNLYRVEQDQFQSSNSDPKHVTETPVPMASALMEKIPEIKYATRYRTVGRFILRYQDKHFPESGIRAVDSEFLEMFTFPFIEGNKSTALDDPYSIILTKNMAEKYFEDESPIGKTISVDSRFDVKVTGIIENVPSNSSMQFTMLVPYKLLETLGLIEGTWVSNDLTTFVQLHENMFIHAVNKKIDDLWLGKAQALINEQFPKYSEMFQKMRHPEFMLQPITKMRLYVGNSGNLNLLYIRIFSAIAFFILLIACVNFMNLSTAGSSVRSKEIGMRKVVGAVKSNIIKQFFTESITLSVLALLFSLIMLRLFIPVFNNLAQRNLSFNLVENFNSVIMIVVLTIFTGIVAGSYPALFLSKYSSAVILKGGGKSGSKSPFFRRILVVFQFTLFIIFIVCTFTVYDQVTYLRTRDPGFDREVLSYIRLRDSNRSQYPILKTELSKSSLITGITGTRQLPFNITADRGAIDWEGKETGEGEGGLKFNWNIVDYNFTETLGLEILRGKTFSDEYSGNYPSVFLVNEEVEKIMGAESAVGKRFKISGIEGTILGVIKNYNYRPLFFDIGPLVIHLSPEDINFIVLKISGDNITAAVEHINSVWKKIVPDEPIEFFFFEDTMRNMYLSQERLGNILKYISIIVAAIACLGLFGLALFTLEQRTKEIGIRKVLGSSIPEILGLVIKDFLIWILWAFVLASPLAYLAMKNWLNNFAYRINPGWEIFLFAGLIAFGITLFTISFQTIKAAFSNPVEALRYE